MRLSCHPARKKKRLDREANRPHGQPAGHLCHAPVCLLPLQATPGAPAWLGQLTPAEIWKKDLALPPAGPQTTFAMNNPKISVDTQTLLKAHNAAESFSTALALMCAMSLKDADKEINREAINEAQALVTEAMAVFIAFAYMMEKGLALSEQEGAEKNPALIAFCEACLVHQKMRDVLLPFVESKCNKAWGAGPQGPQDPRGLN